MAWAVRWAFPAEQDLKNLPHWQVAARVDAAIQELANTGKGDLRRVNTDSGGQEYRLYVRPFFARVTYEVNTRTIIVWRIRKMLP
jgi:mRNA-degrading endonuclease RelE of RelBE toxin-antitoxin system